MRFVLPVVATLGLCAALTAQAPRQLYQITNPTAGQMLLIRQQFDLLDGCCGHVPSSGPIRFVTEAAQQQLVSNLLPTATHVRAVRSYQQTYSLALAAAGIDVPPAAYYTAAEIEAAIDTEVATYPGLAAKVDLSALPGGQQTHEGRPIYALKVSDNVAVDEDEPAILIIAQHHARELNSPHMVIGAMQRTLAGYASDPELQDAIDNYEIWFVPMVNPDGVEHCWNVDEFWRKNRRDNGNGTFGVDLNRNYPTLWSASCGGSTNTNSSTYRGPSPGSEPETVCMRNLAEWIRPEIYIDFHSSGQEVLRTYPPCANTTPTIQAFIEHYVDDLRAPMTFGKRDPSASGEAPEDHWAESGTNSYLIEIGTSFQPDFSLTVAEEIRVWPGVERAMTTWAPAVRGHVNSSAGPPLEATITYEPNPFLQGEVCRSRGRDGRYGLWLPLGSWTVTYDAPGHVAVTIPVTVNSYDTPVIQDIVLPVDAFVTFGQGCPGSAVSPPPPCPELNPSGGFLSNDTRDNEYCYRVPNTVAMQVSGFDIWTGSTGGTVSVPAAIYGDNNGSPSATALATTTVSVGATQGFYTATFNPPVQVNGTFYLGLDTSAQNAYISTLTLGSDGLGFYRDLVNGPTNWTASGLVQRPAWIVDCTTVGNALEPTIGFNGTPQIGTSYQPTVSDAAATTFALLVSGVSNQFQQGLPLPLPLPGAPGCDLQVSADVLFVEVTDANGDASSSIAVPGSPAFVGATLYHQWVIWDEFVNSLGLVVSDAGAATFQN